MDNTMYVALSRQMILRRQMDVVANNIANAETAGFKVESLITETEPESLIKGRDAGPRLVKFTLDTGLARDFTQGSMASTGAPLDLAIEGDAFFRITTPNGDRYTRDGRFTADAQGRLTTAKGQVVGGDITLDPARGEPSVSRDGVVSQAGVRVGKIEVVRFASLAGLSKDGDGLYRNDGNIPPEAATDALIHQGMIEGSNVEPVVEITRMMQVAREYERIAKMMDQTADLDRRSIERLGRVN